MFSFHDAKRIACAVIFIYPALVTRASLLRLGGKPLSVFRAGHPSPQAPLSPGFQEIEQTSVMSVIKKALRFDILCVKDEKMGRNVLSAERALHEIYSRDWHKTAQLLKAQLTPKESKILEENLVNDETYVGLQKLLERWKASPPLPPPAAPGDIAEAICFKFTEFEKVVVQTNRTHQQEKVATNRNMRKTALGERAGALKALLQRLKEELIDLNLKLLIEKKRGQNPPRLQPPIIPDAVRDSINQKFEEIENFVVLIDQTERDEKVEMSSNDAKWKLQYRLRVLYALAAQLREELALLIHNLAK